MHRHINWLLKYYDLPSGVEYDTGTQLIFYQARGGTRMSWGDENYVERTVQLVLGKFC